MQTTVKTFTRNILIAAGTALLVSNAYAGNILTNKAGMTLYTFDKDKKSESVCYDACAQKWPPYLAAEGAKANKKWGITTRKDGSKQWTYKGQPLYTWVGDTQAGDANGDGVGGVWHVAKKSKGYKTSKSGYGSSYSSGY